MECPFCGVSYHKSPPSRSHIIPDFFRRGDRVPGLSGHLVDVTSGRTVQNIHRAYMLCAACEQRFNKFETELAASIALRGMTPLAFRSGHSTFKASLSILWRVGLALTGQEPGYGRIPTKLTLPPHRKEFKSFMYEAKLYLKGVQVHFTRQSNVWALQAPEWRKGSAFETVLPFILCKNSTGLLVIGALIGQVVLVAILARDAAWDRWYAGKDRMNEVPPELQLELKKLLDEDMRKAITPIVEKRRVS